MLVTLPETRYRTDARPRVFRHAMRMRALPGVQAAGAIDNVPLPAGRSSRSSSKAAPSCCRAISRR